VDIQQKKNRPGVYRLNYADFSEVYGGPFVSATIYNPDNPPQPFKQVQDNPLQVLSQLKVQIDKGPYQGQASKDYLPLFFCPKKQYWDTDKHKAQDFDKENNCYFNASMSLRGDDEVIVACQLDDSGNLTPKFVIGFVDRVPREGEDVIKIKTLAYPNGPPKDYYWRVSQMDNQDTAGTPYPNEDKGPDGLKLQLLKQAECILDQIQVVDVPPDDWPTNPSSPLPDNLDPTQAVYDWWYIVPEYWTGVSIYNQTIYWMSRLHHLYEYTRGINIKWYANIKHFLVPVGAILYCVQVIWVSICYDIEVLVVDWNYDWPMQQTIDPDLMQEYLSGQITIEELAELQWQRIVNYYTTTNDHNMQEVSQNYYPYTDPPQYAYGVPFLYLMTGPGDTIVPWDDTPGGEGNPYEMWCQGALAAQYTDKLYENTKSGAQSPQATKDNLDSCGDVNWQGLDGSIFQQYEGFTWQDNWWYAFEDSGITSSPNNPFDIFIRPHSKKELQDAGMWPFKS
jgi:hypothetical protein